MNKTNQIHSLDVHLQLKIADIYLNERCIMLYHQQMIKCAMTRISNVVYVNYIEIIDSCGTRQRVGTVDDRLPSMSTNLCQLAFNTSGIDLWYRGHCTP